MERLTLPLDKASALLASLYNNSRPLGLGYIHFDPMPMTQKQASELLDHAGFPAKDAYFDYLQGRVMKVGLSADLDEKTVSFQPDLYDRDIGQGAAKRIVDAL